jgi:hypothetical protein
MTDVKNPPEREIEKYCVKRCKEHDILAIKMYGAFFIGIPDRILLAYPRLVWFAEIKRWGKTPTPIQVRVHSILRKLGFPALIIDSKEKVDQFIKENFDNDL